MVVFAGITTRVIFSDTVIENLKGVTSLYAFSTFNMKSIGRKILKKKKKVYETSAIKKEKR